MRNWCDTKGRNIITIMHLLTQRHTHTHKKTYTLSLSHTHKNTHSQHTRTETTSNNFLVGCGDHNTMRNQMYVQTLLWMSIVDDGDLTTFTCALRNCCYRSACSNTHVHSQKFLFDVKKQTHMNTQTHNTHTHEHKLSRFKKKNCVLVDKFSEGFFSALK